MWTYDQRSGKLTSTRFESFTGLYSGHGEGVNNPAMQDVRDVGPIPAGYWSIGAPEDNPITGPFSLPLAPLVDTNTFGRSGFLIHGDLIADPGKELASHGCIVAPLNVREAIARSADPLLLVQAVQ